MDTKKYRIESQLSIAHAALARAGALAAELRTDDLREDLDQLAVEVGRVLNSMTNRRSYPRGGLVRSNP